MYALNMINDNSNTLVKENLSEWDLANKIRMEARMVGYNLNIFSSDNDSVAWNRAEESLGAISEQVDSAMALAVMYDMQIAEKRLAEIGGELTSFSDAVYGYHTAYQELVNYRRMTSQSARDFEDSISEFLGTARNINVEDEQAQLERILNISGIARAHQSNMKDLWRAEMEGNNNALGL